ncbi:MAG: hypothetical protein LAT83_19670 [Kiritimatiellae bacterium]|nr:hypothetical protein [Kiritimatiellia bacterium]
MSAYQDNTPAFVEDIMGFRNQMRLLRHTLADGANKIRRRGHAANRADQMVEALFAEHFFDDASIQAELNKIFHSYAEQLQGSRNQLYARVKVHMKDYDMDADGLNNAMLNDLQKEITQVKINEMMGNHAQLQMLRTAVGLSDITWVGGKALGFAKGAMALKAASMGGATVKAGAAGAAGGSAVGPKGTIAGVAGGVIVGLMIDTWAGNKIQEKLIQQTNDFHDNFRKSLLHGNGAKTTGLFHMSEDLLLKMESVDLAVLQEARGFAVAGTTVQTGRTAKVGN